MESKVQTKNHGNLVIGIVLIFMGLFFLANNFFDIYLNNWWALFILIPAFVAFTDAWKIWNNNDSQFTREVKNRIIGGIFPLTVALIFLFNLNWGTVWPVFIIIIGLSMLFR